MPSLPVEMIGVLAPFAQLFSEPVWRHAQVPVIVDEAHHAVAATYWRILERAGAFRKGGPLSLGVTATPTRGDGVGLSHVFQKIVYRKTLLEMIMAGYLADLRAIHIQLYADFRQLRTRAGDFVDAEVANLPLHVHAPEHILAAYQEHAPGRKTLLFTPTVHLAELMAELFNGAGIPTERVHADTPLDERRALLQRFRTGETRVITNCGVLTEGYDEPSVDCVIVARPTQSTPLFTQMVGRGTRLYPSKTDCLVIDVVGASTHHHLASVASLTGLPLHALHTRTVREVQEQLEQVEERQPVKVERTAQTMDLFRQRPLHWLKVEDFFSLSLGDQGWIILSPEGKETTRWQAALMSHNGEMTELASGYTLPYIQGIAEDHARKVGAGGLTNPKAYWRQNPASDKQLNVLRYLRIPHPVPLTMGEASDMITQAKMREAVMRAATRGVRA
ncbi:MAG: hypothetical protein FJ147_27230 [Deltaproteobacteria bacterium]|nr:hypothetical protein [Deltaproteobacteria bacterium]